MNYRIKVTLLLSILISYLPIQGQAEAAPPLNESRLFQKMDQLHSEQMIIVTANSRKSTTGRLYLYNKQSDGWQHRLGPIPVVLGQKGMGKTKEGDGRTPIGTYTLGTAFGSSSTPPAGLKTDYRTAGADDYWIDASKSPDYNSWVAYEGDPHDRWASFERLNNPLYKSAMVINYNTDPVIPGKGSAIFMHIWRAADKPTDGCIAMSETNLLQVLTAIDPDKSPKIRIAPGNQIY